MRPNRLVLAIILAAVGLVWIGQGMGIIAGSVMTGSSFWAVVGVILVAIAVLLLVFERRRGAGR